jgi:hypothetical protein
MLAVTERPITADLSRDNVEGDESHTFKFRENFGVCVRVSSVDTSSLVLVGSLVRLLWTNTSRPRLSIRPGDVLFG